MVQKGLTEKQWAFVRYYFSDMSQRETYRKEFTNNKLKDVSCDVLASRLLRNVKVQKYLEELRQQPQSEAVLTKRARIEWLSRVVTAAPQCGERGVLPVPGDDDERVRREMPDARQAPRRAEA